VIDLDAPLGQQLLNVAIRQPVAQVITSAGMWNPANGAVRAAGIRVYL